MRSAKKAALEETFQQIHGEGQGVWQFAVFSPENTPELILAALAGQELAIRWLRALSDAMHTVPRQKPPMLCLLCQHTFRLSRPPAAFAMLTAKIEDPSVAVVNGLCPRCFTADRDMQDRIAEYYRKNALSDLRMLPPIGEPGRA
jgi:hypothetical protein